MLPLPFGLIAVAELSREKRPRFLAPGFQSIRLDFPTAIDGDGLQANQISMTGGIPDFPPCPRDESAGFAGATAQLRNGHDAAGILPDGFSVLGDAVTDIFNGEFAPGQARPRVPLTRIDWSGYGATCFSDWRNPAADPPAVSQVRLDGLVGRTAYEVVQVFSFLYPWGVRVVRTITLQRSGSGGVFRRDSGWQAISDGLYDFRSGAGDPGIITHPGIVRGLFDVRHIRDTTQLYQRVYPNPDRPETVKLAAVRFDADVDIEGVLVGANSVRRVPASDMIGYIQLEPSGTPLSPAQLNDLLIDRGPIGGSVDCVVDIGASEQRMRVSTVEVDGAINLDGNPEFIATARGSLILPRAGRWSVTYQAQLEPEPHALASDSSFPLIRQNPGNGAVPPYRFADPVDLFRPDNPSSDYALLQSTDAQRLLFQRPKIEAGDTAITSTLPFLLADAYILAGGVTMFPRPERCIPLPDDSRLQVTGSGRIRLFIPPQPGLPTNTFIAAAPERILIDSGSLKARLIYSDENDQPTQVRIVIDSDAHPDWATSIGPVSVVTDLDALNGLMRVVGTFTGQTDKAPNLDPHLVFGGVLQPVQEIINILQKIDLPFPLFVLARANQLKVGGTLEIPPDVLPTRARHKRGIDIGVGRLEGELKVLLNLSGEPGQGILAPQNQTLVEFELRGNIQGDLLPPIVTGGPMFRFSIEGRAGQSPKIRLFGGTVGTAGLNLDVVDVRAEVAYTFVAQIRGAMIGLGVDAEAKMKLDVLDGLASVEATAEFLALASRLLIDAPGGPVPGPTVEMLGEITFAVEVTLGWIFDIDIEVQTEFRTRLNLPLFVAAALLL